MNSPSHAGHYSPNWQTGRALASLLLMLGLLILPLSRVAALEAIESPDQYTLPADMSAVHFYLITVDVGDRIWDNFGHTALRVIDEDANIDLVFNWGLFRINGGPVAFSYNFFKGIMNYELGTKPPNQEFAMYRAQERSVWQDKINLTNPQKEILYTRLLWNSQPENIVYPYQYFFDNCTTRVRDYLDEALSGRLAVLKDGLTDSTFRDQVRAHYESVALIGFSLDVLMNSNIDRPMTEWEAMFLPLTLREQLYLVESDVAENGVRNMLLSGSQQIMQFPPPTVETDPYQIASITLLAPVLLLFLMLKKIPMSYFATHSRIGLNLPGINFRLLGLLGILVALFSGIYGILMLGSWFVSGHLDLHHNINLLLFWPTDLLGIFVALRWLIFCRPWPMTHNSSPFLNYYMMAHVFGMAVYAAVTFLQLADQSTLNISLYVLPGLTLFTVLVWLVGFEPAKPRNSFF
ncbi:DUF4105 domain-containing protein [Gammaproteobacteria bacterium]|jgi:hypothetical protein|nr:DUF4105 domain-containing protein [Pseudomonadales bacterium]MDC3196773.1 DUF4105 domain-containing protein [Gammaproteobacteria bacterium]